MARVTDAILQNNKAYSAGKQNPMLDLRFGGQMGYAPDYTEWVSNTPYVRKNLIALLVDYPRGFEFLPNPEYWIGALRALVELHPLSIEGLNAGLEVSFAETPFGGAGEVQEVYTDVKRARTNVVFNYNEKDGMPITNFFAGWIENLMMNANTKFANVATFSGNRPTDMLPDISSMTVAFFEPNADHTKVVKSWLVAGMMPRASGDIIGRREITTAQETLQPSIGFTGMAQYGPGVDLFCQNLLSAIDMTGANPNNRTAFANRIAPNVLASRGGYERNVENTAANAIGV